MPNLNTSSGSFSATEPVYSARRIDTMYPLLGGGDLSDDRALAIASGVFGDVWRRGDQSLFGPFRFRGPAIFERDGALIGSGAATFYSPATFRIVRGFSNQPLFLLTTGSAVRGLTLGFLGANLVHGALYTDGDLTGAGRYVTSGELASLVIGSGQVPTPRTATTSAFGATTQDQLRDSDAITAAGEVVNLTYGGAALIPSGALLEAVSVYGYNLEGASVAAVGTSDNPEAFGRYTITGGMLSSPGIGTTPTVYRLPGSVVVQAVDGSFTGGTLRAAAHYRTFGPPTGPASALFPATTSPNGATIQDLIRESDAETASGATVQLDVAGAALIESGTYLQAITCHGTGIAGPTRVAIGTATQVDRFGEHGVSGGVISAIGVDLGTFIEPTHVVLTGIDADFSSGTVRAAVHHRRFTPPTS